MSQNDSIFPIKNFLPLSQTQTTKIYTKNNEEAL